MNFEMTGWDKRGVTRGLTIVVNEEGGGGMERRVAGGEGTGEGGVRLEILASPRSVAKYPLALLFAATGRVPAPKLARAAAAPPPPDPPASELAARFANLNRLTASLPSMAPIVLVRLSPNPLGPDSAASTTDLRLLRLDMLPFLRCPIPVGSKSCPVATVPRSTVGANDDAVRRKAGEGGPMRPWKEAASDRVEAIDARDAFDDLRAWRGR